MKRLLFLAALAVTPAAADTAAMFYDPSRQLGIAEYNWFQPWGKWQTYGFVEVYKLPAQGFPPESTVIFGKGWLMYEIAPKVRIGAEIEYGRNNAGMWTRSRPFEPDQWRVIPKLGISVEVR